MSSQASQSNNRASQGILSACGEWLAGLSPRRREILVGLAAPVLLLSALAAGEGILRYEQYRAFGPNQAVETKINRSVWQIVGDRRRPRPGANMGGIHFNSAGFRGPELTTPKSDGTIRIGFFGASTVLDPYVSKESKTWPAIVAADLKAAYPKCHIDYFNAGIEGYSVKGDLERLEQDALPYKPDVAIFLLSDVSSRARDQLVSRGIKVEPYKPSWFAQRSLLWEKLEKNVDAQELKRRAARRNSSHRLDLDAMMKILRGELEHVAKVVKGNNILPVFVGSAPRLRKDQSLSTQADNAISRVLYMPDVYIRDITNSYYRYNATLKAVAEQQHFPFVDTIDHMPDGAAYYVDTSHTTAKGSGKFGSIVGKALVNNPRIRALIHDRGHGCDVESPTPESQ